VDTMKNKWEEQRHDDIVLDHRLRLWRLVVEAIRNDHKKRKMKGGTTCQR